MHLVANSCKHYTKKEKKKLIKINGLEVLKFNVMNAF